MWTGEEDFRFMRSNDFYKGWWPILDKALALIEDIRQDGQQVDILQVKEKFGGLRIYVSDLSQEEDDSLQNIVDESLKTCQICGQPGKLRAGGWWLTLCDTHNAERKEQKGAFKR